MKVIWSFVLFFFLELKSFFFVLWLGGGLRFFVYRSIVRNVDLFSVGC